MKAAVVGLPQSGKTTLMGAVTGTPPDPAAMPQVHHAIVKVPDPRLDVLARLYKPKKITEATMEFVDVPGFSSANPKSQEDLKRYLPEVRQCDLLIVVLRAFDNPAVPAHRDRVDPAADLNEFLEELIYADLFTVETRLERIEKALKKPSKHDHEKHEQQILTACRAALEESKPLLDVITNEEDRKLIAGFQMLTLKPLVAVCNVSDDQADQTKPPVASDALAGVLSLCALTELEIAQLDPADRPAFLEEYGLTDPARDRLIQKAYEVAGLISFLTAGEPEVRAWTVTAGSDAVEAASQIHSDIARGFIRAETVAFDDLVAAGEMKAAKAAGKVRQEGKAYIVHDGDVILFKFNI